MSLIIDGSNGVTFNDASLQGAAASPYVLKNRIINGAMVIDQRNAGASVTPANTYTLDRWASASTQSSKFTVQQNAGSVTPPTGFSNYLGVTSSSAYSLASGDFFLMRQPIEGYNISDLSWGTANAKTVTLSFWVRSSLTGTFGGSVYNADGTRSYPFSYSISSANTWEQKTITIAGDTSGTWLTTNGLGINIAFSLGSGTTYSGTAGSWAGTLYTSATGATSVVGTNAATFYITGVQLEVGSTATPFERRLYNQEFANCQRYFWQIKGDGTANNYAAIGSGLYQTATLGRFYIKHPISMRTNPTASYGGNITTMDITTPRNITAINGTYSGLESTMMDVTVSGASGGRGTVMYINTATTDFMTFSAEL